MASLITTPSLRKHVLKAHLEHLPPGWPVGTQLAAWCLKEDVAGVTDSTTVANALLAVQTALAHESNSPLEPATQPAAADESGLPPSSAPAVLQVTILPTKVWVENDFFGGRHVMVQHEGLEPFTYASFFYDWRYTSNSGTWDAACRLALSLGAQEPVESRMRKLDLSLAFQTASWLQDVWLRLESAVRRALWRKKAKRAQP